MIKLEFPDLLETFKHHLVDGRTESASFLTWYLENYYRLDPIAAVDAVCDQRYDKGVDGIYLTQVATFRRRSKLQARIKRMTFNSKPAALVA